VRIFCLAFIGLVLAQGAGWAEEAKSDPQIAYEWFAERVKALNSPDREAQRRAGRELIELRQRVVARHLETLRKERIPPRNSDAVRQAIHQLGELRAVEAVPELLRWYTWARPHWEPKDPFSAVSPLRLPRECFDPPAQIALDAIGLAVVPHVLRYAAGVDASTKEGVELLGELWGTVYLACGDEELFRCRLQRAIEREETARGKASLRTMLELFNKHMGPPPPSSGGHR